MQSYNKYRQPRWVRITNVAETEHLPGGKLRPHIARPVAAKRRVKHNLVVEEVRGDVARALEVVARFLPIVSLGLNRSKKKKNVRPS